VKAKDKGEWRPSRGGPWPVVQTGGDLEPAEREWLHTNGAGAYAMSSVALLHTRRHHGAFVAALEYATGVEATIVGKPSAACFAAALAALDAEPELTWMVTDDLEQDVRGAQLFGMKTLLLRTGKFRPDTLERSTTIPDAVLSSIAQVPDWINRTP